MTKNVGISIVWQRASLTVTDKNKSDPCTLVRCCTVSSGRIGTRTTRETPFCDQTKRWCKLLGPSSLLQLRLHQWVHSLFPVIAVNDKTPVYLIRRRLAGLICFGLYAEIQEQATERKDGSVVWVLGWDSESWGQVPAPPQVSCVSLGKSLSLSSCLNSPFAKLGYMCFRTSLGCYEDEDQEVRRCYENGGHISAYSLVCEDKKRPFWKGSQPSYFRTEAMFYLLGLGSSFPCVQSYSLGGY